MGHCDAMELRDREFFVYQISAGYIKYHTEDIVLYIYEPNLDECYSAQEVYNQAYQEAEFEGVYTIEEMLDVLRKNELWSDKEEATLEGLPKEIEDFKVKMFENLLKSNTREKLRGHLKKAKNQLEKIVTKKHGYDLYTCSGYASYARACWIVEHCTRLKGGVSYNWRGVNLNEVMNFAQRAQPSEEQIREIAKTDPFRTCWGVSKEQVFSQKGIELTDIQKGLMLWSKLYDGIHENPDCPSEDVIQDDDLFDGWLIFERRKRETEKNKNSAKEYEMDADEVFIPVETQEDQVRVDGLNDPTSQMVVKQRHNQIQKAESLKHSDLIDVRRDLQVQANEQYKNKVKG
jgi:hypothetical protein